MYGNVMLRDLIGNYTSLIGGEILYDSGRNLGYVCILKNAHSWFSKLFMDNLDYETVSMLPSSAKAIIILRDPISRWVSGFAQFMTEYDETYISLLDDPKFQQIIFDIVNWDHHTARQIDSVETLELQDCLFFKCNSSLEQNLIHCISSIKGVSETDIINNDLYNQADDGSIRPIVNSKIQKLINNNPIFKKKLLDYYDSDMQLISYINKHNLWYSPNTNT